MATLHLSQLCVISVNSYTYTNHIYIYITNESIYFTDYYYIANYKGQLVRYSMPAAYNNIIVLFLLPL